MVVLVSLLTGLASALFPPVNIEAYLVGLAALHDGPLRWAAVLAVTVGHMLGKLVFYALGRGWLLRGLPRWVHRKHGLDAHLPTAPPERSSGGPSGPPFERSSGQGDGRAEGRPVEVAVEQAVEVTVEVAAEVVEAEAARGSRWARFTRGVGRRVGLHRVEALAGRPWATAALCLLSASVGLPPFAVVAVLLGRFRMPVVRFLLVGGLGRLLRFGAVAGAGGLVFG